jgi:branched-chain amino acid aminotransferase
MPPKDAPAADKSKPVYAPPPGVAYIDGAYVPVGEAKISILDWGFLRSDATFDVVHVWKGRFFRLDKHIDRFLGAAGKLRLALPVDRRGLEGVLMECVRRSRLRDSYVEMIATRGLAVGGSRDPRDAINQFIAFAIPFSWIANEEQRKRGLHLVVSTIPRIPPESVDPTIKNYHRLDFVNALFEAYERGGETVVMPDFQGNVTEGPGFNVFVAKGGELATPRRGVLEGITRETIMELAAELGIKARHRPFPKEALYAADEVFVTSTAGGVMPVTKVDGRLIGNGQPGVLTQELTDLYWKKHADPAWSTPVAY